MDDYPDSPSIRLAGCLSIRGHSFIQFVHLQSSNSPGKVNAKRAEIFSMRIIIFWEEPSTEPHHYVRTYVCTYGRKDVRTNFRIFGFLDFRTFGFSDFRTFGLLRDLTGPYWTLLDPTGPYWTLLNPTEPYWTFV